MNHKQIMIMKVRFQETIAVLMDQVIIPELESEYQEKIRVLWKLIDARRDDTYAILLHPDIEQTLKAKYLDEMNVYTELLQSICNDCQHDEGRIPCYRNPWNMCDLCKCGSEYLSKRRVMS